jgi:spermidine synthase
MSDNALGIITIFVSVFLLCVAAAVSVLYRDRARLKWLVQKLDNYFMPDQGAANGSLWQLAIVSFAGLFIEVMLIRWIGTEVRIFAYFQNLSLIACFLGFGLGCYWSNRRKNLLLSLAAMAMLVFLVHTPVVTFQELLTILSSVLSLSPDSVFWGFGQNPTGVRYLLLFAAAVVVLVAFLILLVAVMLPIGQWVGFYLDRARNPVAAYSMNLLGSVAGVWAFAAMAFLWLAPAYWFGLAFLLVLVLFGLRRRPIVAGLLLLGGCLVLLVFSRPQPTNTHWSPYQKLDVVSYGEEIYQIQVNNTGYMSIANTTPDYMSRHPEIAGLRYEGPYDVGYRFAESVDRVLIIGAGGGNDASGALRNGAGQVDTVEIDPVIYHLGEMLHPDRPYSSPKVHKILNDGRAYLRTAQERYDVIVFGLLDSHTQFSDYSNMRVDNYVYTEQSLEEARRLLKPHGILIVKFEVRAPWTWIGQRFYAMLDRVFKHPPVVFYLSTYGPFPSATLFVTSNDSELWNRAAQPPLEQLIASHPPAFEKTTEGAPELTTDDWPYIYQRTHSIPGTFLTVSVILLAMAFFVVRRELRGGQLATWHFFFLGAGFLLLETQLVSRLALYFGTTWIVNCVALTAVLLVLVGANLFVQWFHPRRLGAYYFMLLLGIIGNYVFPWERLTYSAQTIGILLSLAYAVPVFFAGVVFTESFRNSEQKSGAFGANIVGAIAGGLAQNVSFIFGMKMLLLVAALFYVGAGLCGGLQCRQASLTTGDIR